MNTNDDVVYDVIQIGYGPVSEISALMLARQGHRVAVFERWTEHSHRRAHRRGNRPPRLRRVDHYGFGLHVSSNGA